MFIRNYSLLLSLVALLLFPLGLLCYESALDDRYDSRTNVSGGVILSGSMKYGVKIKWDIFYDESAPFKWHYVYNISSAKADWPLPDKGTWMVLEIATGASISNFLFDPSYNVYGPNTYNVSPGSIYGLVIDYPDSQLPTIEFYTDYAPVWGDFYSQFASGAYAYNTGYGTEYLSGDETNWIAIPGNQIISIPEPKTYLTLSSFLVLALFIRNFRSKKCVAV